MTVHIFQVTLHVQSQIHNFILQIFVWVKMIDFYYSVLYIYYFQLRFSVKLKSDLRINGILIFELRI